MITRTNGFVVFSSVDGSDLTFIVREQSAEATRRIQQAGTVIDEYGIYGLRTSNYPSKNMNDKKYPTKRNFYVRGKDKSQDLKQVVINFASSREALEAQNALDRLVRKVMANTAVRNAPADGRTPLSTTARAASSVANTTARRNKKNKKVKSVREVTPTQARSALAAVRAMMDRAEQGGYLHAVHRLITGVRANDAAYYPDRYEGDTSAGSSGKDGKTGKSGLVDGKDGKDGKSGKDGKDGMGIVTRIRQSIYTATQAAFLRLTGHKEYPSVRRWTKLDEVASVGNPHADEHYGLDEGAADVLNKAV